MLDAESLRDTKALYHLFLGHRQVSGGAQVGELAALFKHRLGLKCWRDLSQTMQDVDAMIRGVAQSAVYVLYLTSDALTSYFVTIEARAAMELGKPLILFMDNDSRKPSYAGGSVEKATEGWPEDLKAYLQRGRFVAWGGQPFEWSLCDQYAKLETVLQRCVEVGAAVPSGGVAWADAVRMLVQTRSATKPKSRRGAHAPATPAAEPAQRREDGDQSVKLLSFV